MKFSKADWESYNNQLKAILKKDKMNIEATTVLMAWIEMQLKEFPEPKKKNANLSDDKGDKGQS